ncbi:DUF3726 domain-containing protein [Paraburkholderia sacchari]|uniref:DUF3726 domain-containing protein n=2 Tax=Paraburkholderia sacchari TaxID=159450 RepID=UPI00054442B4|nr:DUF3726 domain-containing protein [Paraburkholderia sacchari]NLP63557.1 DUF3726 domain-containing protein [Paraburkholderia sacchari]
MKMAMNELVSLCRAALEGSGWEQGDYEDAADAAGWLQALGLDGLSALDGLLGAGHGERVVVEGAAPGENRVQRCMGLAGCALAFELAWAEATRDGIGIVRVSHTLAPRLALYGLKTMSARGRHFDLAWSDAEGRHYASTTGQAAWPAYLGCDSGAAQAAEDAQELIVCCRANAELHSPIEIAPTLESAADPSELEARYYEAIWRGLDVEASQTARLAEWKERVLVAATQSSRDHGAGGADDGF